MKTTPEQRIVELLLQVLQVTKQLAKAQTPPRSTTKPVTRSKVRGIYPHQSKFNPWRVQAWDTNARKSVYLGAFPTIAKAKAALAAFYNGEPISGGSKVVNTNMRLRRVA